MNKKMLLLTILVIGLVAIIAVKRVMAEDESEDYEDEKEQAQKEYERQREAAKQEYENEREEAKSEDEDEREDYEDEDDWDFSDDFENDDIITQPTAEKTIERVIVREVIVPQQLPLLMENIPMPERIMAPEINEMQFKDDDNDGIMNKDDLYPEQNDLLYIDSDNDGIVDAQDRYSGKNDFDFQDEDRDGVIDSHDSDTSKKTDIDHDGIDDYYDEKDDRFFFVKILALLGIIGEKQ